MRWKGYNNPDDDTWETIRTLRKGRNLVKEYEDKLNSIEINTTNTHKPNHKFINPDRIEKSLQCEAKTRRNIRCKNRTRRSNMCQPHLMKFRNLRITDSNVKGAGLVLFNAYKPIERIKLLHPIQEQNQQFQLMGITY